MFVYEFMSGIADVVEITVAPDGKEDGPQEEYDPHKHRKIEKPTSYGETMTHLLKGSIGAGILAMPDAVRRLGVIYAFIGILLIGAFATYCIHVLIIAQYELCKRKRVGYISYPKSMEIATLLGPKSLHWLSKYFAPIVDFVLVFWQLGLCAVYAVFVAENVKQVCDFYHFEYPIRLHLVFLLVPLLVLNMVKDLKLLTPLSSISNILTLLGLILVFFYLLENDIVITDDKISIKGLHDIPIFVGTTLFALEAVGVILALEFNMENPKSFLGPFGLFNIGMFGILSLYILVGICGYLTYGKDIKASITLNLPRDQKKAQTAKLIIALAILLTFPLQNFVAYSILWLKIKRKYHSSHHKVLDYLLRFILIIMPWSTAVAIPRLGPFISLVGAFCLSILALILPAVLDLFVWWETRSCINKFKNITIILVGFCCLGAGVYTSILEILAPEEEGEEESKMYYDDEWDDELYNTTTLLPKLLNVNSSLLNLLNLTDLQN